MKNQIEKLTAARKLAEAYNAQVDFRHVMKPVRITLPDAGIHTGELVRDFNMELRGLCELSETEVDNRVVTFWLTDQAGARDARYNAEVAIVIDRERARTYYRQLVTLGFTAF